MSERAPEMGPNLPERGAEELLAILKEKMDAANAAKGKGEKPVLAADQSTSAIMERLGINITNLVNLLDFKQVVFYEEDDLRSALTRHLDLIDVAIDSASKVTQDTLNLNSTQVSQLKNEMAVVREKIANDTASDSEIMESFVRLRTVFLSFGFV